MLISAWKDLENEIITCRRCPRLVEWRERVAKERRLAFRDCEYWGKPVPGFGDHNAAVLAVGLAPGAHGSNRTGRMFTGDASGDFLYPALYQAGFANQATSHNRIDGLVLNNLFISALCRCVPPGNMPAKDEIENCLPYLLREIKLLDKVRVFVALGALAYQNLAAILTDPQLMLKKRFTHGGIIQIQEESRWLIASYHPSRQNTQTGRLTKEMFDKIWSKARLLSRETGGE